MQSHRPRARPPTAACRATTQHSPGLMGSLEGPSGSTRRSARGVAGCDRAHAPPHAPMATPSCSAVTFAGGSRATGQCPFGLGEAVQGPSGSLKRSASGRSVGAQPHVPREPTPLAAVDCTLSSLSQPPASPTDCLHAPTHARTHARWRPLTHNMHVDSERRSRLTRCRALACNPRSCSAYISLHAHDTLHVALHTAIHTAVFAKI